MSQLMPVSDEQASALNDRFAATLFRSTEDFIGFYNSGLANKATDEVANFAQDVSSTFKNVKLQGKNLVFISEAEVYLAEVLEELRVWEVLVKVKSRVADLVAANVITDTTVLHFAPASGLLSASSEDGSGDRKLSEEKFFKSTDVDLVKAAKDKYSTADGEGLVFHAVDFLELNEAVIGDIHARLFKG